MDYLCDVLIPTMNEKGYIESTLKNLTQQNLYRKDQMHVVIGDYKDKLNQDDDYLLDLCKKYKHITYMPVFRKGIAYSRNVMAAESTLTDIFLNFDADSQFTTLDAVEKMIRPIVDKEMLMTNCRCVLFDFQANQPSAARNFYEYASNAIVPLEKLCLARGPGLTVDKTAFWTVGGFRDVPVAEDYWLSFDLCMYYSIHKKKFMNDVLILTSDRRAKSFEKDGLGVFNYTSFHYR